MKNIIKKFITCFICCTFFGKGISFKIPVEAKVIEPEIVKTESWTASYFIDGDRDTLYPYVQCEADIYNDGTLDLWMWNTCEWDGFATVSHTVTLNYTRPISDDSDIYKYKIGEEYTYNDHVYFPINYDNYRNAANRDNYDYKYDNSVFEDVDVSYYPNKYSKSIASESLFTGYSGMSSFKVCEFYTQSMSSIYGPSKNTVSYPSMTLALPNMKYFDKRPSDYGYSACYYTRFRPTVDPTETYNFRLFGHDITITPDILSEKVVSSGTQSSEIENLTRQVEKLKEENEELKSKLNTLTNDIADVNRDGKIDLADALTTLHYYTRNTLLGENITWEELLNKS